MQKVLCYEEVDTDTEMQYKYSMSRGRKSKSNKSRRRFDDEQVKLLETMFETESRPELRMKQQLANKLGLQPRQVAIWFQNKRARSKSKQIEQDYTVLKFSYDNLVSKFESLKTENESLLIQLKRLQKMTEQNDGGKCQKKDHMPENENHLNFLAQEHELGMPFCIDKRETVEYLEEEADVLNMANTTDGSLTSVEDGYTFETDEFLEWEYQL